MPRLIGIYEYRFVANAYEGTADRPWEHIGLVLAAAHPDRTWTDLEIRPVIEEIAATMEENAKALGEHARSCERAGHLLHAPYASASAHACVDMTRRGNYDGLFWCQWRARDARETMRTPERPMLVRVRIDLFKPPGRDA